MSLHDKVWPNLVTQLSNAMVNVAPLASNPNNWPNVALAGLQEGERFSVPQTPWAWLLNDGGDYPRHVGNDLTQAEWQFILRCLSVHSPENIVSEHILMPFVDQAAQALRAHIKLGTTTTLIAEATHVAWGFILVNDVFYRNLDIHIKVTEKEVKPWGA